MKIKPNQRLWSIIEDVEGNIYYQIRVSGKILKTIKIEEAEKLFLKHHNII